MFFASMDEKPPNGGVVFCADDRSDFRKTGNVAKAFMSVIAPGSTPANIDLKPVVFAIAFAIWRGRACARSDARSSVERVSSVS